MPLKVLLLKCRKIWITFWATDNNDAKLLMHSWLNRLDVKFGYRQMKRDTIQSSCISIAIVIYCMLWFSSKKTSYKPFFLHATDCTHVLYSFLSATLTVFFFSTQVLPSASISYFVYEFMKIVLKVEWRQQCDYAPDTMPENSLQFEHYSYLPNCFSCSDAQSLQEARDFNNSISYKPFNIE